MDELRELRELGCELGANRCHVAVVGEFNRGKSTVVNALLGADLLPRGVVPVTAVATAVVHGEPGITVTYASGEREEVDLPALADFVTESGNPGNLRGVAAVEVRVPCRFLADRIVLVDSPGLGSVHVHNTEAGQASVLDADGAIVVIAGDAPLSRGEAELLAALAHRGICAFVVVNKCDQLEDAEILEVRRFVDDALRDLLGNTPPVYFVAARAALLAERCTTALTGARSAVARSELRRVALELTTVIAVRNATVEADAEHLAASIGELRSASLVEQRAFDDDVVLLRQGVAALVDQVAVRLEVATREAARGALSHLDVELPGVELPAVAEQRERFDYLFLRVGSTGAAYVRPLGNLVPRRPRYRRRVQRARDEVARELDKHAGRLRADLERRLLALRDALEAAMRDALETRVGQIFTAVTRGEQLRAAVEAERERSAQRDRATRELVDRVLAVTS